jgi:hypothetical protein
MGYMKMGVMAAASSAGFKESISQKAAVKKNAATV